MMILETGGLNFVVKRVSYLIGILKAVLSRVEKTQENSVGLTETLCCEYHRTRNVVKILSNCCFIGSLKLNLCATSKI